MVLVVEINEFEVDKVPGPITVFFVGCLLLEKCVDRVEAGTDAPFDMNEHQGHTCPEMLVCYGQWAAVAECCVLVIYFCCCTMAYHGEKNYECTKYVLIVQRFLLRHFKQGVCSTIQKIQFQTWIVSWFIFCSCPNACISFEYVSIQYNK